MTRQRVDGRRFGTDDELRREASAWSTDVTARQRGVDWQMTVDDARIKLASVDPKPLMSRSTSGPLRFV